MKNKKVIISFIAIVLVFSVCFGLYSFNKTGKDTISVALLDAATTQEGVVYPEETQIIEVEDEETPAAALVVGGSSTTRNLNSSELEKIRTKLVSKVNQERKTQASNITVADTAVLETTGNVRAKEIVQVWSHTRPNGSNWETVLSANGVNMTGIKAGEDLAKVEISAKNSYSDEYLEQVASTIHTSLMNSTTHKAVILNKDYKQLGVGLHSEVKDGKVTVYVTEHFKNETSTTSTAKKAVSTLTVSGISSSYAYTAAQIKPTVTVKNGSTTLKNGTDYTVSYGANKALGKGSVTITGKGNYSGSKTVSFTIAKKAVSKLTISGVPSTKAYTGKAIKPSITVKNGSTKLKSGTDYTVSYGANKSTGKATIKITGKGNYSGSVTKTFYITPKAPTSPKVTAAKKSAKVSYKKSTGATGYEIAYSTKKTSGFKTVTATGASKTISKLTSKKTYYVKIRAYKTVNGKKYYSPYTAVKSVKVK